MTELFVVSFDECDDRTLRGRVHLFNPGAAFFPKRKEFPVQLIMDAWSMMLNGHSFGQAPFSRDEGVRLASQAPAAAGMRELEDLYFGATAWVGPDGCLLEGEGSTKLREPKVKVSELRKDELHPDGASGTSGGRHYVMLAPKPDEFRRRADAMVVSYHLGRPGNVPNGRPPERLDEDVLDELLQRPLEERPYAPFVVKVTSARYLEPLRGGMRWGTAHAGLVPDF